MSATNLESHQIRVMEEQEALSVKVRALRTFIRTSVIYATLPFLDQNLLCDQLDAMARYENILIVRIGRFQ